MLLGLSYYSNALLESTKLDAIISKLLLMGGPQRSSLTIEALSGKIQQYRILVQYESVDKTPFETNQEMLDLIKERLEILEQCRQISVDRRTGAISLHPDVSSLKGFSLLRLLDGLLGHVFDTYLIACLALQEVSQGNLVIKESRLVSELHTATQRMYDERIVPQLVSCLRDTFRTAIHRMADLGMATVNIYQTEEKESISYISSSFDSLPKLKEATLLFIEAQGYSD